MIPSIAIVGRPNVGKSTLFNRLTGTQNALVVDAPGITRDRQFGEGEYQGKPYILIDTGGLIDKPSSLIEEQMLAQAYQAVIEADVILFVVDARAGLTPVDSLLANQLRKHNKNIVLAVNKVDGMDPTVAQCDFLRLGFEPLVCVAASQNWGMQSLLTTLFENIDLEAFSEDSLEFYPQPKVAIIGRPNAGKSTLVNRMLGEQRLIVSDVPGTTRDSIFIKMSRFDKDYTLIDTAGIRRRKNVTELVEKFSAIKALQAIKQANVVLLIFDAREGISVQDLSLIDFTIEAGRSLIICANKWDGMSEEDKQNVRKELGYRLRFAQFAPIYFISALHGTCVGDLFAAINKVYDSAMQDLSTPLLTQILLKAVSQHSPPLVQGRRIKLRFAHCGGHNPPKIIIHGNQTSELPQSYYRYLEKFFIKALKLVGTPVKIICKTGDNPYKDKVNRLTPRQVRKRQRLMKHVKGH